MQCALLVVLLFGLSVFEFIKWTRSKLPEGSGATQAPDKTEEATYRAVVSNYVHDFKRDESTAQWRFVDLIDQFHKAQCYFSVTVQVASLRYGIFDVNLLNAFMIIPLATNGVLPVLFAYALLLHCHKATLGTTIFTSVCWLLSSLVYWVLYSQLIPINDNVQDEQKRLKAYAQFAYKLSALDACGNYSALAACPLNPLQDKNAIAHASHKIRVLTPIIWAFSTFCLFAIMVEKFLQLIGKRKRYVYLQPDATQSEDTNRKEDEGVSSENSQEQNRYHYSIFDNPVIYGLAVLCFLAGTGMQLSLFSVALALQMTDRSHWSFGQLIALTIWFPPFIAWFWNETKEKISPSTRRKGKSSWRHQTQGTS